MCRCKSEGLTLTRPTVIFFSPRTKWRGSDPGEKRYELVPVPGNGGYKRREVSD